MAWKIHIDDVPETRREWSWQDHPYQRFRRSVSEALGNDGSHPFDAELTRVPPGAAPCPVHEHSAMWEFFIVLSGQGEVHRDGETSRVGPGDCFLQPAGTRHRVRNASDSQDLVYWVIANEAEGETTRHAP